MSQHMSLFYKRQTQYERLKRIYNRATQAEEDITKLESFLASHRTADLSYQLCEKLSNDILDCIAASNLTEAQLKQELAREKDEVQKIDTVYWDIGRKLTKLVGNSNDTSNQNSSCSNSGVKLPPIPLPVFSGKFSEWSGFKDLFDDRVHKNKNLSCIEKFYHLTSSLSGEPLNVAKSIPASAQNYPILYKQLCDRYDNSRILATIHWHNILDLPVSVADSSTALYNLLNVINENLSILNSLGLETNHWSFVMFDLVFKKLPKHLCTKFESTLGDSAAIPSFDDLKKFLENHSKGLESIEVSAGKKPEKTNFSANSYTNSKVSSSVNKHAFVVSAVDASKCKLCKSSAHSIQNCPSFLKHDSHKRYDLIKELYLCLNCLKEHSVRNCSAKNNCFCKLKHNRLLHFEKAGSSAAYSSSGGSSSRLVSETNTSSNSATNNVGAEGKVTLTATSTSSVLLSTVMVKVKDSRGNFQPVRTLLDTGSMTSFMTQKCANSLGMRIEKVSSIVTGINAESPVVSSGIGQCYIKPLSKDGPVLSVEAYILPHLVSNVPPNSLESSQWEHLSNLHLADPLYKRPGAVDMILGIEVFSQIVRPGKISGEAGEPIALDTSFGWILMGKVAHSAGPKISLVTSVDTFDLRRFWETEQVPEKEHSDPDDVLCEQKFVDSVSRDAKGRYIVELPFKNESDVNVGNSYSMAQKRFYSLERRFAKDAELKQAYSDVILGYLEDGYLVKAPKEYTGKVNFLPHTVVWRPDSSTTRCRPVYDASAKTDNGRSLNDCLLAGPKLQADICSLLLNLRLYKIIVAGDIKKMFLQILVAPKHQNYQRILWRFSPENPLEEFLLTSVTFGLCSSPYLAIRTVLQLVRDEGHNFPLAAQALTSAIYVDDCLGGADTPEEAQELKSQLVGLLNKGGFEMRKWASNCPLILRDLPAEDCQNIKFDSEDSTLKLLGLQWIPSSDCFAFHSSSNDMLPTKRSILSDIARIWDPLGFLAPITFFAKHLIQFLWSVGAQWDDTPPIEVVSKWTKFKSELSYLSKLKIPRFLDVKNKNTELELHGFCDSSIKGYACCIYLRAVHSDGSISIYLLCGKSKVASLKKISLPRLELCGAVLLSKAFNFVLDSFQEKLKFHRIYAWSDSTIAISWIKSSPHRWKTFVANRVSFIQEILSPECWNHLVSADNPADVASRGILPRELIEHSLWWNGPSWLRQQKDDWPVSKVFSPAKEAELEAAKPANLSLVVVEDYNAIASLLERFSSLRKIQGIVAHVLRFIRKCRKEDSFSGAFTEAELYNATITLAKVVQHSVFVSEIATIKKGKLCEKPLRKLSPFLDEKGLIRVGGRLRHSHLTFDSKFPVLLPRDHAFTYLIIFSFHEKYLHPGPQTLQYLIGQQFWILGAKRAISSCLSKCYRCFRVNPKPLTPPMGDLPACRVSEIRAFTRCGVDLGGPFKVTVGRYRGAKSFKSYICVFVCFATKAIHIELVSSLSTDAFVAAFRRFVARRGKVVDIHSDCGTNFIGADREFSELMKGACEGLAINWHFNPPSAPHMGGLWEAAIKSVKSHIARVVGEQVLTFEEFTTLLTQIESVLNSRPLMAMSSSPNDLAVITPNHFLNLDVVSAPPDEDLSNIPLNRLSRWQLIQNFHRNIWQRWSQQYLQTLQQRQKWFKDDSLKEGHLVIIKQDNVAPGKWVLGRILKLHYGADKIARVARVKTALGEFKRPLVKLCPLPSQ